MEFPPKEKRRAAHLNSQNGATDSFWFQFHFFLCTNLEDLLAAAADIHFHSMWELKILKDGLVKEFKRSESELRELGVRFNSRWIR